MKTVGTITKKLLNGTLYLVSAPKIKPHLFTSSQKFEVGDKVVFKADLLKIKNYYRILTVKQIKRASVNDLPGVYIERSTTEEITRHERLTGTLCSRSKYKTPKARPEELWDSSRIRKYFTFCDDYKLPTSILSWKYGVVPREKEVFNYDQFSSKDPEHWRKVLSKARDEYGIKEIFLWFEPAMSIPTKILQVATEVFPKVGSTKHLYNLVRFINQNEIEPITPVENAPYHLISSFISPRSRVIILNSGISNLVHTLTTVKRCKCIVYDPSYWARTIQKAIVTRQSLSITKLKPMIGFVSKKFNSDLQWLDGLLVDNMARASLFLYLVSRNLTKPRDLLTLNQEETKTSIKEYHKKLLTVGKYKRVEVRYQFPRITQNDTVIIQNPVKNELLEFLENKKAPENSFQWEETMLKVGRKLPSQTLILKEDSLREVNTFHRKTGKYFSDRTILTYGTHLILRCS